MMTCSFVREEAKEKWQEIRGKLWTQAMAEDLWVLTDRRTRLSQDRERRDQERREAAGERMRLLAHPA